MAGVETLADLGSKFRLYGVCGGCHRMQRLDLSRLRRALGAYSPIGCVSERLRCQVCGSRGCSIRIVWTGDTEFAYR